jgi:peptidyl-dipeptidase Dcp
MHLRSHRLFVAALAALAAAACGSEPPPAAVTPAPVASVTPAPAPAPAPAAAPNPFFEASTLPYHAPRFDLIHDSDYEPAFEKGMADQLAEIAAITAQTDAPTFDNTIVPMERSGQLLTRVAETFFGMAGANTNDTIQGVQKRIAPKLAAHGDTIHQDPKLWARIKAVYDHRDGLDAEAKYLVERYRLDFVRAGADLSDTDKATLRKLNEEEQSLMTDFQQKLLAATKAGGLVVDHDSDLKGMSPMEIGAATEAAKARKLDGKWLVPLQNTTQQPAQASLEDRGMREKLFEASAGRAEHSDDHDTRKTVLRLAELRAQKAKLLGFATWADYQLADQMAGSPQSAIKLMTDMAPAVLAKAKAEAARMQKLVDKSEAKGKSFKLAPWDWQYYSEQVRKADYALDEEQLKPYFELNRVLQDGVFFAANQMYGLTFKERKDVPTWDPDVRVFEVFDKDGQGLALFYADYFKRDNKNGGAWMSTFVDQAQLLGQHPVVFNVCNFTKPAPGQPALLSSDDVRTMFHEFGHALHGMFSNVKYPFLTGTQVPRDFVEFPSQFNEHWMSEPHVFANYAKHYQTGAPMPAELAAKIEKTGKFDKGFSNSEYLEAALLDMAWHTVPEGGLPKDVDSFESDALKKFKVDYALVPPRYRTSYFMHIWGNGYSAGYYAYLWSRVLADDAYHWFVDHGGMTKDNAQRFRDMVLSRGHTEDMAKMYKDFRGADPSVEYLLEDDGLKPEKNGKVTKAIKAMK